MDLPKKERVRVACVSLGFLEIWWYINFYIVMYDFDNITSLESIRLFWRDRQPRSASM